MFPLDFEEFLWAIGDNFTMDAIKEHFNKSTPFGQVQLRAIMNSFRTYMCVGGMPQAVIKYIETHDFTKVDFVKKTIVSLYQKDIKDQEDVNSDYVGDIFENIPSELSKHDKEFVLTHVNPSARLARYDQSIGWIEDAMIANVARNVNEPSAALSLSLELDRFKMYLCDTGLLINLAFKDGSFFDNEYYKAIMMDKLHINEGMFVENVVAQCLRANGHKLRYHVKTDKEAKKTIRKVDFIIRMNKKIIPIEVKSNSKFTIKSIIDFRNVYSDKVGRGIVLHEGDIKKEGEITYLPYFMACIL